MFKKNKLILLLLIPFLFFVTCSEKDDGPEDEIPVETPFVAEGIGPKDGLSGQTALEYVEKKGIWAGWNLGNTYDLFSMSRADTGRYDLLFPGVKAVGFSIVRLPVSWTSGTNSSASDPYTINADFMASVVAAVDAAYDAGLVVILNTHHDNGTFNLQTALNEESCALITARFKAIWAQIAEQFKDYGDWLIFEPLNEPRVTVGGMTYWDNAPDAKQYQILNDWNQAFVDTVRASSSEKNKQRYLIAKAYAAKPARTLDETFVLPTDPTPGKQIVSFHYYLPEEFSLNGRGPDWNANSGQKLMADAFGNMKLKFVDKGIPVFIGECGATYQSNRSGAEAETANANRLKYLETLGAQSKKYGLTPILWDNGEPLRSTTRENGSANSDPNGETFGLFKRGKANTGGYIINGDEVPYPYTDPSKFGEPADDFAAQSIKALTDAVKR